MYTSKSLVLAVISFLIIALIYSSFSRSYVAFAAISSSPILCYTQGGDHPTIKCCQTTTDDEGIEMTWCTICDNTNPPSNCSPRFQESKGNPPIPPKLRPPVVGTEPPSVAPPNSSSPTTPGAIEQPPSSIAPPTSETPSVDCTKNPKDPSCATKLTPSVDCTKNPDDPLCKPAGINPPPSDSANLAPDNNKNNNSPSTDDNKPKGSELGQLIGGGLSATKKGNKDNSPTPPPCPTDNSPIPPNCTLKPKF